MTTNNAGMMPHHHHQRCPPTFSDINSSKQQHPYCCVSSSTNSSSAGQQQPQQLSNITQPFKLSVLEEVELESDSLHHQQKSPNNIIVAGSNSEEELLSPTPTLLSNEVEKTMAAFIHNGSFNIPLNQQENCGTTTSAASGSSCYSRRSSRCSTISSGVFSSSCNSSMSSPYFSRGSISRCKEGGGGGEDDTTNSSLDHCDIQVAPLSTRRRNSSSSQNSIGGMPSLASICFESIAGISAEDSAITNNNSHLLSSIGGDGSTTSILADSFSSHQSFALKSPIKIQPGVINGSHTTQSSKVNNLKLILIDVAKSRTPAETLDCLSPMVPANEDQDSSKQRKEQLRWEAEEPPEARIQSDAPPNTYSDEDKEEDEYVPLQAKGDNDAQIPPTRRLIKQRSRDSLPCAPRRRSSSQDSLLDVISLLDV